LATDANISRISGRTGEAHISKPLDLATDLATKADRAAKWAIMSRKTRVLLATTDKKT
jgi:hypothetical protein